MRSNGSADASWAQPGDPAGAWGELVGAASAGMERGGGASEAVAGATERSGRLDQRLDCGLEFRRGDGADGGSCAWHLIPRWEGDCKDLMGGARRLIEGRQGY